MTNVKMNMKNKFETHECRKCQDKEETQFHVYTCDVIWKIRGENKEKFPSFEKMISGSRNEKIQIAKVFKENFKILERGIS